MKSDYSNVGLKEAPDLRKMPSKKILKRFNVTKCELDIQNNEIEILSKLNQPQFECVRTDYARNNSIKFILVDINDNKIDTLDGEIIE